MARRKRRLTPAQRVARRQRIKSFIKKVAPVVIRFIQIISLFKKKK